MQDLYKIIKEYREQGSCMLATILDGEHIGEKVLFHKGKVIWSSDRGGFSEKQLEKLAAVKESGMINDGGIRFFAECFGEKNRLVICGGGHVSSAVIRIGKSVGFDVTVLEDRPDFAGYAGEIGADTVICGSFEEGLEQIEGSQSAYFVVVTRGHRYDLLCLRAILEKENAYVGMMGSRKRAAAVKEQLQKEGIEKRVLDRVHAPIGLAISAETPEEIAVSIMAEIIQCKNKKKQTEGYRDEILDALSINVVHDENICDENAEDENANDSGKSVRAFESVLAEIVWRKGSAPRNIGAKMVIHRDGTLTGTIGGGSMEAEVIRTARQMFEDEESFCRLKKVELTAKAAGEEGMVCGGTQLIYMEKRKCI